MTKSKSIILIHGNFVNNLTWAKWKSRYEEKGYTVYTPANPGHEGNPIDLRYRVHPNLIETGFINNPDDERYLNSDAGQQELAEAITQAVIRYKSQVETPQTGTK